MATWSSHGEKKAQRMKPSEILHAFSLAKANAARHATSSKIIDFVNTDDHTSRVTSAVSAHKPLFEASPAEVWIDEYTPFHALVVKLSFRNCDTVARRMKIEPPQSPFFRIAPWVPPTGSSSGKTSECSSKIDGKIAAGMDIAFQLEFSPHEIKEYALDLVCCTERERFLLPVRVRGRYAALDIPDDIRFGLCPVKMPTSKVFTVHNVGTRGAKFAFKTSENFGISPHSAVLEQGAGVQLELFMTPPSLSKKEGELMITDDVGQTAVVHLVGDPANVDVYLSQPLVEPNPTYISLSSRKTIKICNESEFTLEFCWKSFRDFAQEEVERDRILEELARMESAELEQLQLESGGCDEVSPPLRSSQSPFDVRKAIENKYKLLRKATMEDNMQFADDCFAVAPLTGRVWPHSEVDVVVCFSPITALLYSCFSYLEIAGQEARLPLQIRGQGIGPRAKVVYNELLDFGDVFISDERTRDFTIQNKGEIPATFELLPISMPPDMAISISPSAGTLAVNTMCKIEVTFCSNELGEVFTPIRFRLQGSEDQLAVRFKANVIPPVFHFDVDAIDFGAVSYSFPQTKVVKLISASKITMKYSLRIPEEANYKKKEFELIPANGKLEAFGEQEVRINFTSLNVKVYDYRLVISVTGVGSDLLSIPIKAHCHVPDIVVQQPELDFGTCFLRYPHKQTLVLENTSSHLYGRFEIGEQDDHSKAIATYNTSEFSGTIGPLEKVAVDIYLSCEKLGSIRLPMVITIPGSTELPLSATLMTIAAGPKVEIDQLEIHWGNCSCLVDHERVLVMTNTSLIPAPYKTFVRNARSKFQIDKKEGTLAPGDSVEFILTANLDDTILFKDQLHILITEGENLVVPLAMKGIGTTMWSPSELRLIDFGYQMTNAECEWSCTLENKGKRAQVLTWINRTAVTKLKLLDAGNSTTSKRSGPGQKSSTSSKPSKTGSNNTRDGGPGAGGSGNSEVIPVFSVFPASIELKPRTACVFIFKGLSASAGHIQEELVCETRVGKEKNNKVAFVTEICGDFINPRLAPSASLLAFEYVHHPGIEISRQSKPLSLTNVCELPLSFTLRTQTPFSLDCWEAILQPGEQVDFNVEFYPGFKDDHLCRVINGKIVITYTGHPQKDSVDLLGDISFPNLSFESSKIEFGCTLNDTQKAIPISVTNVSKVDTTFRWVFIEDEKEARALATAKKPYIPINQVFDILPIRGHLKPNECERIEFIFYGHANRKFKSTVVCEVEGGPEYELTLTGEASSLVYKLDKQFLDFGQVLFNKTEDREFSILNVGKVPYGFNIVCEKIGRGRLVEITPSSGKIAPNDKQKVLVRLRPGIPEQFEETVVLEVAHFQPIEFKLFGVGIFASVNINLPRENHPSSTIQGENPKWRELKKAARRNLELSTLNAAVVAAANGNNNNSMTLASSDSRSTISTQPRIADRTSSTVSMPPLPAHKSGQRSNGSQSPSRAHGGHNNMNSGPQIDELDVEIEACRLFFAEYLLCQESKKSETRALQKIEATQPPLDSEELRASEPPSTKAQQRPESSSSATAGGKSTKKRTPESFPFVLSQFVLDFGNVVLGTHKIKKFSITNIGHVPASFQLDKNFALSRGFQIEPERVVRLPEKQAVEFTVTFQARKNITLGVHQAQLPIVMKNGPPCILTIRAHVTVPDISISMETLDFGKMAVSTCHTMFTQLQNTSAVPAEWAVKKPMGSAKDLGNFRITPQTGVLAPGNKANIQVEFIPDDNRHFTIKLPIKVTSNPKTRSITCKGEGSELRLRFQPPMVELGPMLPCSGVAEHIIEMRNDSDYDVEVFSLDFDPAFNEDEELLRHLSVFNSDGLVNLPLRPPGQPLNEYLMENGLISAESMEAREPSSAELTNPDDPLPLTGDEHGADTTEAATLETMSSSATSFATVPQEEPVTKPVFKPRKGVDYIILGPPRCGKSTQAQLLADKENLRVWTIDDAIRDVCMNDLALLDQILQWRVSQPDLQNGGVLDGFENAFVTFEEAVTACSKVLTTARVIVFNFDEECYEVMVASLKDDAFHNAKSASITPVSSKELLSNQMPFTGLAADMMQEESGNVELKHSESGHDDPKAHSEGSGDPNAIDGAAASTANLSEVREKMDVLIATGAAQKATETYSEYLQTLEANKHHVVGFLMHERGKTQLPNDSSSSSLQTILTTEPEAPTSASDKQLLAAAKDWIRPANFLLDIQINDPGPALFVHNMVYSAVEKHVRELESSHLAIPSAAKYQVVRRPTERFPRKPVTRFKILALASVESAPKLSNQLEDAGESEAEASTPLGEGILSTELSEEASTPASTSRWIIPARSKVDLSVQFSSMDVGVFDCNLGFEIFGLRREFTLFCRGVCTVPSINSDPRNVFMSRVKSRPESAFVQKKFVLSKNQFEFGPLIVLNGTTKIPETEQEFAHYAKTSPNNVEVFRMSSTSAFPLRVDFAMEKANDGAFAVFPAFLEIAEGETKEVTLWTSPTSDGLHENNLICCVSDNPEPIPFAVSCFGCTPSMQLRGPWEQPAAGSTSESESSSPRDVAHSARLNAPPAPVLDFEQLLLKRQEEKTFVIENVSPIAISWRLLCGDLPSDFRLFPMDGMIKPLQKALVLVVFTANSEAIYKHQIQIQFSDAESALSAEERNRVLPLVIAAEAYKIDVSSFDKDSAGIESLAGGGSSANSDGSLDFGLVRVGESPSQSFNIRNRGKYNIKYLVVIRTHSSRELFKVEPMEMVLEPDSVSSVKVTFHSKHEVSLRDCKDIKCTIVEMISGEPCREFTVFTTVRSVFSVFRVQPNRGINFGPHKYNDQTKTKRIEIRNDGEFPFKFRIQSSSLEGGSAAMEDALTLETQLHPEILSIGQFMVSPDCGSVDPGVIVGLDVAFQPKDCKVYRELLHIEISGRNPFEAAGSSSDLLQYELVGESCFPGITTGDFESIFEEQIVMRSIDLEAPSSSPFSSVNSAGGLSNMLGIQSVVFAEKEKIFSFGTMIAAANSKGTVERFKITNPTKVSTTVQFQISAQLPSGSGPGSTGESPSGLLPQAFTVQPSVWEIPPLEHRFVSVYFKPTTITSYQAWFTAKVDDSPAQAQPMLSTTANDCTLLQFELRGEGTMPCVSMIEPTLRDTATGSLMLNFGRVRVSKAKDLQVILRNDGILSATVLFSIQSNPNFFFALGNSSVLIAPKATETLILQFKPQKTHDEPTTSVLKITVHNNPFDETAVKLVGTGYREDLVFEDLPFGHDDELHFDDIRLSNHAVNRNRGGEDDALDHHEALSPQTDVKVFSLCNQSGEMIRFAWPKTPPFVFTPAVGHLKPKAYKLIRATFTPSSLESKAMIYDPQNIALQAQRISYKNPLPSSQSSSDWDENARTVSFEAQQGNAHGSDETLPEPVFDAIGAASQINLKCFAAADVLSFECDTKVINFKRTFMMQVCSHRISVRNKSKIKLEYSWRFERAFGTDSDGFLLSVSASSSDDDCPFEISPGVGRIAAEDSQVFTVKFAPMEVDEHHYVLVLSTDATHDDHDDGEDSSSSLRIEVRGSSLRPACHFDVDRSDYTQRRAPHLLGPNGELGPLDPSVKVIEMESLGVRVRNTKRFYVVNPTNISYEFTWTPEVEINPCFRCATPKGLMLAGKRCEMIFEFTPQQLELQEMFWRFQIPHFQVNQLFLFVGTTTEPRVILDRGSVNFNTLLIGTKALQSIALVNHEHIPFNFVFDKASLDFANEIPALLVHPLSGVIPPNSRSNIDIEFVPTEEKTYNFNLSCIIKRKPTRLSLNVKGEGYSIHDALTIAFDDQNDTRPVLLGAGNLLDFGGVRVNEELQRTVVIHNMGKFNFEFNWSAQKFPPAFAIEPIQGTVKKTDKVLCKLTFAPLKQCSLDGTQLACTIAGSRNYLFALHGNAVPPSLQFSFMAHDFGPCFIGEPDALPISETVNLSVFNMDPEIGIDLDCMFEKKPHLRVDCPPTVLGPRESVIVPITITARHETTYAEMIPFTVNGSSTISISVRGEGIVPKVELVNPSMQNVAFSALQIGQQVVRTIKIVNRAKKKISVELVDGDAVTSPGVPSLDMLSVSILSQREIVLRPKETADIEFKFAPTKRIPAFQKDVFIEVAGSKKKLVTLSGCCQGMEVSLDTDTLSFGTVCLGSQLVRKVRLQNRGDVAAKFQWNPRDFAPDFTVSPIEGMVAPNYHKTIEITFKPTMANPDLRYDHLACVIEGASPPVYLTLVGGCVKQATSSIQELQFESRVREFTTKQIVIENKTSSPWNLFPVVTGEHWSCQESVAVPAEGKTSVDIVYFPLRMTREASSSGETSNDGGENDAFNRPEQLEGSIFFAIPDGTALLYNVAGKAAAPVSAGTLSLSTPAKKTLPISVTVKNWLKLAQTFDVEIEKMNASESVSAQGPPSITVQGGATRNYKLKFFSYTEGAVSLVVRFKNPENGEYLDYDVNVTVTKVTEVETLHFEAPVRQSLKKVITIENPFDVQRVVSFADKENWWKCTSAAIRVRQLTEITGRPEGSYEVEYRPTLHLDAPVEAFLTISFAELGEYTYKLVLATQPAGIERILHFKAPLGGSQIQSFAFTTFSDKPADLACTVHETTFFSVPGTVKIDGSTGDWDGRSNVVQIKFEPEALGEVRDTLTLFAESVGEYKCTLHGVSVAPLPQGPFVFASTKDIEFRNVFSTPKEFEVMVDNPRFTLSTKTLSIPAKSSKVVSVKVDHSAAAAGGVAAATAGITGKLFVSCPSHKELPSWVYYLESTPASST
ncbi:Hydrocephalus-inducing [Globisporangium polare]